MPKARKRIYEYNNHKVVLKQGKYQNNGRLAIAMEDARNGELYAFVSRNLPDADVTDTRTCAYVDINNLPDILNFLFENGIAMYTGRMARSGYCAYPEWSFDTSGMEVLK